MRSAEQTWIYEETVSLFIGVGMDVMQVILNYGNYTITNIDVVNGCITIGISFDNFYQTHGNGD